MNLDYSAIWLKQGNALDAVAVQFLRTLVEADPQIDDPVEGYVVRPIDPHRIFVIAHHCVLRGETRHLIRGDGEQRRLFGAIEFRLFENEEATGEVLHRIYFDLRGRGAVDGGGDFNEMLTDKTLQGASYLREATRKHLLTAIQSKLLQRI